MTNTHFFIIKQNTFLHVLIENSILSLIKKRLKMLKTEEQENNIDRVCHNPDCGKLGIYPAPKSRDNLKEYFYFCIDHVRDFNKSWNYFEGLNEDELEVEIRKSVTWDRPSWKFGTKTINHDFQKAFEFFDQKKEKVKDNVISKKLSEAFKVLGLSKDSNLKDVKTKYKILAKKWHPDALQNIEDKVNKDKFVIISNAYKLILKSFAELKNSK